MAKERIPRSTAIPAEGENILVFGTLHDVADAAIAEHVGEVIAGVLEEQFHAAPAARTVGVTGILNPTRPTGQFIQTVEKRPAPVNMSSYL